MATVYILHSKKINRYYIGSCLDLQTRIASHLSKENLHAFTRRSDDWELFFEISNLEFKVARAIEAHIKKMKSKTYLANLVKYPEISLQLIEKYCTGSSR